MRSDQKLPTGDEALAAIRTLIAYIGDDPERGGLVDTPKRVLAAWRDHWGVGYLGDLEGVLTTFENDADMDQMIIERGISFTSHCEHHLAPFSGTATVAYLPSISDDPLHSRIVGISKLARIVEHFAAKLQVQERLTANVADFISGRVSPNCAVSIEATHSCMTSRGVKQQRSVVVTTALRGIFRTDPAAKQEFLAQVR